MNQEVLDFNQVIEKSWENFLRHLPALTFAVVVFLIGFLVIRFISKIAYKVIEKKSEDPLISDFLINIFSFVLNTFLLIICLSILGWGSITDKILAGAGISTFVVGFALKDIGENFLAGILMAFRRPFRVGDLIEFNGLRGNVTRMSLRETSIKSLDGRDIFIPNGLILKNPLQNYTIDNIIRNDFLMTFPYSENIQSILDSTEDVLKSFKEIQAQPAPSVFVESFSDGNVNVRVLYWILTSGKYTPNKKLKSTIMIKIYETINHKFKSQIQIN